MPPSNEHTITAPLPENELRQLIHQAYGDDESTAMLTQVSDNAINRCRPSYQISDFLAISLHASLSSYFGMDHYVFVIFFSISCRSCLFT